MKIKNFVILGDSYSTFEGYNPEGYACYYYHDNHPECGVDRVEKTWWHLLSEKTGAKLCENNSWSGSTISYAGRLGDASSSSSFIYRFRTLCKDGFFEKNNIDTLIIFGGTNDNWIDTPLGELEFRSFEESELFPVRPAIAHLFMSAREALPDIQLICVINSELKPEVTDALEKSAEYTNAITVKLENIEKAGGHPTAHGMTEICNQILKATQSSRF